jgi:hypothetical protein
LIISKSISTYLDRILTIHPCKFLPITHETSPESETDFPDISQPSFEPPPKSQRWLRLFIALVLIIGGAGAITSRLLTPEKPSPALANAQPPAVKVKLSTVQTGTVEDTTEYIANLESRQLVNLQPTIQGQVTQIFVRSGDSVSDGAAIMQIDAR